MTENDLRVVRALEKEYSVSLAAYLEFLASWNTRANLVSRKLTETQLRTLVRESLLCALPEIIPRDALVVDLGSGNGVPGIPLAICRPDLQITLTEKRRQKASFLYFAAHKLGLKNVVVHAGDIIEFPQTSSFDVLTARFFSSFADLAKWGRLLLNPKNHRMVLFKPQTNREELSRQHLNLIFSRPVNSNQFLLVTNLL
jgi:16S rRNA (guanine527-N7)-methyltransferase